ncbi:MAG TPA: hypothetical protein VE028_03930 [Nitratidesulfovibrio sp.]|nr:hypothetical protein [Nitratidesulfovibrio sp.]
MSDQPTIYINPMTVAATQAFLGATMRESKKLIRLAINDTVDVTKTDVVQGSSYINMKASDRKKCIKAVKANYSRLSGRVTLTGRPNKLIIFKGTRQTRKGVSVRVLLNTPREVIPTAMIATMPSGHKGVFWRKKPGPAPSGLVPRLPIGELYGPSFPAVYDKRTMPRTQEYASAYLPKRLNHYIALFFQKQGPFKVK